MPDKWTDEELGASVAAYLSMQDDERAGRPVNKREVYRALAARFPRTKKAFEYRMQNISYLLAQNECEWLSGLVPAANVGADVAPKVVAHLNRVRFQRAAWAGLPRPRRLFARAKDGKLLWPFSPGVNPEDIDWTPEDDAEFKRLQEGGSPPTVAAPGVPSGASQPKVTETAVRAYVRDAAVVAWVLAQADGHCECCGREAPFVTAQGIPFLEVHHMRQLAHGGSDTVYNAVALCPNCHRSLHFAVNADAVRDGLYASVKRLVPEPLDASTVVP